jgi:hypothetical protein
MSMADRNIVWCVDLTEGESLAASRATMTMIPATRSSGEDDA